MTLSRRSFLAGAAAMTLTSTAMAQKSKPGYIDAHSHIWTRDIEKYPLAPGITIDDLDPPSFTTEELLETANPNGVDRVVLIQHSIFYLYDNSYMIDAAKAHPGTFAIVGMVDSKKPHPDEAMKKLLPHSVTGFRIVPPKAGDPKWLQLDGMQSMWKCGGETGQAMCCLINPEDLPQVDKACQQHPDTPVVIDHFARIGIDGTIRDADVKKLCDLARFKNTHVKISAYYALGNKKPPHLELVPMIRKLLDAYGPERLMWASDAPYQLVGVNNYKDSISLIRDRIDFLTDEDREWLLRKTAEKVFFS